MRRRCLCPLLLQRSGRPGSNAHRSRRRRRKQPQKRRLRKPPRSLQRNPLLKNQRGRPSIHPQLPGIRLLGRRKLRKKESEKVEALVGSTLKVGPPEAKTLIDKIKAEIKKRAELKAQRMLLKEPKRKPKR